MTSGMLLFWMVIELYLTQAISKTVTGFLGHSVQLPCFYSVTDRQNHVMCWGKDKCPNNKCNGEIVRTDGRRMTWSKSSKYQLQGNIGRGDVTLTIKNTNIGDSGTYCCRIEVPGWFNDIKKEIVLRLEKGPTPTTHRTTTTHLTTTQPATTTHLTTNQPTTTTHLTTNQPTTTTQLTTTQPATTTQLATTPLPDITVHQATTTCPPTTATTALQITTSFIPNLTTIMTHQLTSVTLKSTTATLPLKSTSNQVTAPTLSPLPLTEVAPGTTETSFQQNDSEFEKVTAFGDPELLMIIVPLVGFVILLMLLAFILRGKIIRKNYSDAHKRINNAGEVNNTLSIPPGRTEEDEEGLFTL
ncbi:T-cell immunoglobulin and mucin domain-containing protein 4-like [Antechinus flavipes]|uniref:T-cell immunoglobulin and mucin domain-containing protein 4-like n=1 Tax=Antechinus flavipes TaxID=38775 RepID=UPI00223586F5|nr:T-cell immunoglobulin and mucin domain-containing protein 4-like [Antechinus flavipes]